MKEKFTVRLREITFYEIGLQADSYKDAVNQIKNLIKHSDVPKPLSVGLKYEIDSITRSTIHERNKNTKKPI